MAGDRLQPSNHTIPSLRTLNKSVLPLVMSQKNAESQESHPVRQLAARLDRLHALIGTYARAVREWSEAVDRSEISQLETVYGEDPPSHPRLDCPKEIEVMHLDEKGKAECKPYAEVARDLFSQLRTGLDDTANHVDGVHQELTLACQHPGSKETKIALMVLDLKREIVQHAPPLDAGGVFEQLHKLREFQQSGLISNLVNQIDWLSVCPVGDPVGESNNGDAKAGAATSSTKTSEWLNQADAAKSLQVNSGTVAGLIKTGALRTNGKTGRECRINPPIAINTFFFKKTSKC